MDVCVVLVLKIGTVYYIYRYTDTYTAHMYMYVYIDFVRYTDEQAAIQAKQRMLREDWEFFSAQRKILKDQIMKNQKLPHWLHRSLGIETSVASSTESFSALQAACSKATTTSTTASNKW